MHAKRVGWVGTLRRSAFGPLWVAVVLAGCEDSGPSEAPGEAEPIAVSEQALLPSTCTVADGCLTATLSAARTLYADATANNSGATATLCVGNGDGVASGMTAFGLRRALVQYSLPALPSGATLRGAVLSVVQQGSRTSGNDGELGVYEVTASWDPGSNATSGGSAGHCGDPGTTAVPGSAVSWTNQPTANAASGTLTFTSANIAYLYDSDAQSGLYADVLGWYGNPTTNHGWLLLMTNEGLSDTARRLSVPELRIYYLSQDGDACSTGDSCDSGNCVDSVCCEASSCDDGATCTADSCATGSCVNTVNHVACNDANPCTDDSCDPADVAADATSGCLAVANDANACSDGLVCNGLETCSSGSCNAGTAVDCSGMDDSCHVGVCVESGGTCTSVAIDPVPSACVDPPTDDDAGTPDAGPGEDAGPVDAAAGDAAAPADGGSREDAGPQDDVPADDASVEMDGEPAASGCSCRTPVGDGEHYPATPLLIGLALCAVLRRRRRA